MSSPSRVGLLHRRLRSRSRRERRHRLPTDRRILQGRRRGPNPSVRPLSGGSQTAGGSWETSRPTCHRSAGSESITRLHGPTIPAHRPGNALERPRDPARHPSAVEAAGLRDDGFTVDGAAVDRGGHHRDGAGDRFEAGRRIRISPCRPSARVRCRSPGRNSSPAPSIRTTTIPTPGAVRRPKSIRGQVIGRRMAGLQDAPSSVRRRDRVSAELDGDGPREFLQPRRTGIVPHRFLPRPGLFGFRPPIHLPPAPASSPIGSRRRRYCPPS